VLAGRDLRSGGTWFGITKQGRLAALTNYRDPAAVKPHAPSRGHLVRNYLLGSAEPREYLRSLQREGKRYNGFNLLLGDEERLYWCSNRGRGVQELTPGLHGLSNHLLDTPWPKVRRGKEAFERLLSAEDTPDPERLLEVLHDRTRADNGELPDTGVDTEWERVLSPMFIESPAYGTRSSTILLIDRGDRAIFMERTFNGDPATEGTVKYEFGIESG
jgi:uncharacterized protein with NRDE domain